LREFKRIDPDLLNGGAVYRNAIHYSTRQVNSSGWQLVTKVYEEEEKKWWKIDSLQNTD